MADRVQESPGNGQKSLESFTGSQEDADRYCYQLKVKGVAFDVLEGIYRGKFPDADFTRSLIYANTASACVANQSSEVITGDTIARLARVYERAEAVGDRHSQITAACKIYEVHRQYLRENGRSEENKEQNRPSWAR